MNELQLPPGEESFLNRKRQGHYFLLIILIAALVGVFWVLRPFLHPILIAAVLATVSAPIYLQFERRLRGRKSLAAALTCALVALFIIGPVSAFAYTLADMGVERFEQVRTWVEEGNLEELPKNQKVRTFLEWEPVVKLMALVEKLTVEEADSAGDLANPTTVQEGSDTQAEAGPARAPPTFSFGDLFRIEKLQQVALWAVSSVVNGLRDQLLPLLANVGSLVFNFFIMLFVMFYFLREGTHVLNFLMRVSPLPDDYERSLIERARVIVRSAVVGTGLTAISQGILGMIAFAVVGIPWFFYGILMMITSLVPLIGTALVWVPCVVYLLIVGATGKAIGLALWCAIVVGSADNFLRPFFMKGDTGLSSGLLFFAIIGGVQVFGFMGVVYGPLIFGTCAILLHVYRLEMDGEDGDDAQDVEVKDVQPEALPEPPGDEGADQAIVS